MPSRFNLIAILLTLSYASSAIEHSKSSREKQQLEAEKSDVTSNKEVLRYPYDNATSESSIPLFDNVAVNNVTMVRRSMDRDVRNAHAKIEVEGRDQPRRKKRRIHRSMIALLMAYKLKFIALVPTLLGGLFLLKGTTLLAGFFFALFAAVLGLKIH